MGRYIGDAKFGRHVGTDELGNRYFENMNPSEEVPGMSHVLQTEEGGKTDVQDDRGGLIIPRMISMLLKLHPNGTLGCMVLGRTPLPRILSSLHLDHLGLL